MSGTSKWRPEFDVVRTVAILLLLIHHSGFYALDLFGVSLQGLSPFLEAILLGCFFFISGYFTELSLRKSDGNLVGFFASRLIKIYPPYLVALALFVSVLGITLRERFDLLVYLGGLQFVFGGVVKPIITLWYVGAIVLYYLLFGLLWKLIPKAVILILTAVALFILALFLHRGGGLLDVRFFKYYFVFLTGLILARQSEVWKVLSSRFMLVKGAAAFLGILAFSLALEADPVSPAYIAGAYLFIVPTTVLLFTIIARSPMISPWQWVTGVSYASYFIYLFHRPFWKLLENAFSVQGLQNQILFRLLPASLLVVVCRFN